MSSTLPGRDKASSLRLEDDDLPDCCWRRLGLERGMLCSLGGTPAWSNRGQNWAGTWLPVLPGNGPPQAADASRGRWPPSAGRWGKVPAGRFTQNKTRT